jgi:acetyltransferase
MATDATVQVGLEMATLGESTLAVLRRVLPPEASVRNPVDMIASGGPQQYRECVTAILADPAVDSLLVIFVSPVVTDPAAVARTIVEGVDNGLKLSGTAKPVLACFMGGRGGSGEDIAVLRKAHIPCYPFPEGAVQTLAAMTRFHEWRARPAGRVVHHTADLARARAVVSRVREAGQQWLQTDDAIELMEAYGIPIAPGRRVKTPEEAIEFAERVGYPVVLKLDLPELLHKSDVGGVKVDLRSAGEIKGAFWDLKESLAKQGIEDARHLVQKMITGGRETIIGAVQDATVGHVIMFGLGGVFVELMHDVAFRVHPLTDADAAHMIREIRGWPLLAGYRGAAGVDVERLQDVLLRVSQMVSDFPEIAEMDLNPFIAEPKGRPSVAVDARVRLAPPGPPGGSDHEPEATSFVRGAMS